MKKPHISEITFKAIRSRGPGGQNVNKVSSSALLQWDFLSAANYTESEKIRIRHKLHNYINRDGWLQIRSDEYRDLQDNKDRAYEKLVQLVKDALHIPKARKKTKPSRTQKLKRLEGKSKRSEIKSNRRKVDDY